MLYSELPPDFHSAMRKELATGEQILWWVQPDSEAILHALLPFCITWLSGVFLMSVGMLLHSPGDPLQLRNGLIFILIACAVAGVFELIFAPRRASRTVYVLTNKRALTMCV